MLANIIGGFIVILIGTSLLPVVADAVAAAKTGNVTGSASTLVGLTTLFYSLAVATVAIGVCVAGLRGAGLM